MDKTKVKLLENRIKEYYAKIKSEPKISGRFIFWGGDDDTRYDDYSRGPSHDEKYPIKKS